MMDQTHLQLPRVSSCLSPYVQHLLTVQTISSGTDTVALDDNGLIDFDYVSLKLPAALESFDAVGSPEVYYQQCVRMLSPVLHSVEVWMEQLDQDELHHKYTHLLTWTGQHKVLLELWAMLYKEKEAVTDLLVMLVTLPILERALGDLYLTVGTPPCPSMLKDLLVTTELQAILGQNVMQVLKAIIGPPVSLNLRNVVWHGFPFPGEIPKRCVWLVVCLVPSIGKVLQDKGIGVISNRASARLPYMNVASDVNLLDNPDCWMKPLVHSELVNWNSETFWKKVVNLYRANRYSMCATLLLYYLEHGLRRVFASVNNCPQQVLTAEADSLYTTFDEILSAFLPDGSENAIQNVLGTPVMEVLMDLLMYKDGVRLRDRLSHGELEWEQGLYREPVHTLLSIVVHIAVIWVSPSLKTHVADLEKISRDISQYKVQFHGISLVQRKAQGNASVAQSIDALIGILPDLSVRDIPDVSYPMSEAYAVIETKVSSSVDSVMSSWTVFPLSDDVKFSLTYQGCNQFRSLLSTILSHKIPTLYREARHQIQGVTGASHGQLSVDGEQEVLSVMQHVVTECGSVLSHMSMFASLRQQQLHSKQLRSRQRENLKKFLSCFPSCVLFVNTCSFLVLWQLHHLDMQPSQVQAFTKARTRFWKTMLQFCENLRTFTHPDKNKWTESLELINKCVSCLSDTFNTHLQCGNAETVTLKLDDANSQVILNDGT